MLARWAAPRLLSNFRCNSLRLSGRRPLSNPYSSFSLSHARPPTWSGKLWYRKDGTPRSKVKGFFIASFTALFVYTFYVAGEILEQAEEDNGLLCNLSHIQRLDTEFGSLDLDDFDAVARYICEMLFLCAGENLEAGDVDHFANAASGLNGAHREEFYKIVRQGIEEIHRVLHERKGKDPLETAILAHDLMGGTVAGATAIIVMYHDPDGSVAKMIQTYSLIGEKGQPKDRTQKSGDYDVVG